MQTPIQGRADLQSSRKGPCSFFIEPWPKEYITAPLFSCPGQLNRWPCHSVSRWVSEYRTILLWGFCLRDEKCHLLSFCLFYPTWVLSNTTFVSNWPNKWLLFVKLEWCDSCWGRYFLWSYCLYFEPDLDVDVIFLLPRQWWICNGEQILTLTEVNFDDDILYRLFPAWVVKAKTQKAPICPTITYFHCLFRIWNSCQQNIQSEY